MSEYKRKSKIETNTKERGNFSTTFAKIYFAKTKESGLPIYPEERADEILGCKNEKVKREKSSVWTLLSFAVKDAFGKELTSYNFKKKENGKWVSDGFYFSLTHSNGVAGVAISNAPIGVDIENITMFDKKIGSKKDAFLKKVCSDEEYKTYKNAPISRLSALWTAKESAFKRSDDNYFDYKKCKTGFSKSNEMKLFKEEYSVSVCAENDCYIEYFIVE